MKRLSLACLILLYLLPGCTQKVQRYGSVIGVKPEKLDEYKKLHAKPWPEIKEKLKEANIRNYSIYLTQFPDGKYYLFSYFEYTGDDLQADFKHLGKDPKTKEWWSITDPMQIPLENRKDGEWWKNMEEIYHLE